MNKIQNIIVKVTRDSRQVSDSFVLAVMLTVVGGFLDTYSYMVRDRVFANAQTGNLVMMGIETASGNLAGSVRYLFPVMAFGAGVLLAELIRECSRKAHRVHWRQIVVAIEMFTLLAVAFIPQGKVSNIAANVIISFLCAMQYNSFRKISGHAVATVFCTGNLRSMMEFFYRYLRTKDPVKKRLERKKVQKYMGVVCAFLVGIVLAACLCTILGRYAVLACPVILLIPLLMMHVDLETDGDETK